jgi:hypothetical protein
MPVHVVNATADVFAQGLVDGHTRLAPSTAMGLGLLAHEPEPTVIDRVFAPGSLREKAREIRFVSALEDAPGHICHAFVGENDEPSQIVLKVAKLALILK